MNETLIFGFKAKKSLGQNFLINKRVVEKIVNMAQLTGKETVLEVGPGFGILTNALITHARKVIAIEKDAVLYASLNKKFHNAKNLRLIHADALKILPPQEPYFLIANIPYAITSPILDHYIRENASHLPVRAVLMVQLEVAQKICTRPPRMNVLALHVQVFGKPRIASVVSRNNFRPVPKVDSAIVEIEFKREWRMKNGEWEKKLKSLFDIIHKGFAHRRKMLRNMFDEKSLLKAHIEPTCRAETLTIAAWRKLATIVDNYP